MYRNFSRRVRGTTGDGKEEDGSRININLVNIKAPRLMRGWLLLFDMTQWAILENFTKCPFYVTEHFTLSLAFYAYLSLEFLLQI